MLVDRENTVKNAARGVACACWAVRGVCERGWCGVQHGRVEPNCQLPQTRTRVRTTSPSAHHSTQPRSLHKNEFCWFAAERCSPSVCWMDWTDAQRFAAFSCLHRCRRCSDRLGSCSWVLRFFFLAFFCAVCLFECEQCQLLRGRFLSRRANLTCWSTRFFRRSVRRRRRRGVF